MNGKKTSSSGVVPVIRKVLTAKQTVASKVFDEKRKEANNVKPPYIANSRSQNVEPYDIMML